MFRNCSGGPDEPQGAIDHGLPPLLYIPSDVKDSPRRIVRGTHHSVRELIAATEHAS